MQEQLSTAHFSLQEQLFETGHFTFSQRSLVTPSADKGEKPPLSWIASFPSRNSASNFVIKSERVDTSFFIGSLKKLNDVSIRSSSLDCRDKDM